MIRDAKLLEIGGDTLEVHASSIVVSAPPALRLPRCLTGIHLLRIGELIADLRALAPMLGYPDALSLVRIKVEGVEKGAVERKRRSPGRRPRPFRGRSPSGTRTRGPAGRGWRGRRVYDARYTSRTGGRSGRVLVPNIHWSRS